MHTDDTDNTDSKQQGLIYGDLTFVIRGVLYSTHNEIGPYAKEKQYGDVAERIFREKGIKTQRETMIGGSGNIIDLIVEDKVLLEFKAKRLITKEDYFQTQRYLQETGLKLAILVNFRDKYIKPKRIVRIENWKK
jgi:GxxExxY protein